MVPWVGHQENMSKNQKHSFLLHQELLKLLLRRRLELHIDIGVGHLKSQRSPVPSSIVMINTADHQQKTKIHQNLSG